MMLSVIIVNYNVKILLLQCLRSLKVALHGIDSQVIIVDNNSSDGSQQAIKNEFPGCLLIESPKNLGFSKANNLARSHAQGQFILFLNPDTVVPENALKEVLDFMLENKNVGVTGVQMIDGSGRFLPESKRSIPYPQVAFYKMIGLSALFPLSKKFGAYHASHVKKDQVSPVEVLCGAFMFCRAEALDVSGWFDERFFMYGEDIDLSVRIGKAGYSVYYLGTTKILHYKGESTNKASLRYVFTFYNAMNLFASKHFKGKYSSFIRLVIIPAIWMAALLSMVARIKLILHEVVRILLRWLKVQKRIVLFSLEPLELAKLDLKKQYGPYELIPHLLDKNKALEEIEKALREQAPTCAIVHQPLISYSGFLCLLTNNAHVDIRLLTADGNTITGGQWQLSIK